MTQVTTTSIGPVFVWLKLDEILHQRSAIVDNTKNEPVEVEEVKT